MFLLARLMLMATALLIGCSLVLVGMRFGPLVALVALLCITSVRPKRIKQILTAFGTARWADQRDLRRAGMIDAKRGLSLGRLYEYRKPSILLAVLGLFNPLVESTEASNRFIAALLRRQISSAPTVKLTNAVHTAVFAPTGVGKGVSCVIPLLLDCQDSCVVVDFKGELAQITAEHRRKKLGQRIFILDPFKLVAATPHTLNPLDFISKEDPVAIDHCRDLAESQVIRTGQEKEPHWLDVAELWIAAMIATVVQYGDADDRSLQTVRGLLTDPAKIEAVIKLMCSSDAWGGMLARMGHQLTHFKDKELGSTLTSANRFQRYLDTVAIAESTRTSTFNPSDLRNGKITIYLVLPPEHARAQSPLLRMWISSLLRACIQGGLQERTKVHFILDEAASLGSMEQIQDAIDKYRGYGVRLLFLYQSLGQLKKCFPEGQDQTLLSNVTSVFFGVQDLQTAEYVSNRLGEQTIIVGSGGSSTGTSRQFSDDGHGSSSYSRNDNDNWQQSGRKLLKPEEVLALAPRTAVTFTPGLPPICTTLTRYYEAKPSRWRRFKRAATTMAIAFALLVGFGLLALVLVGLGAPPPQPQW
jgi:type IV secretion system protein VirD4